MNAQAAVDKVKEKAITDKKPQVKPIAELIQSSAKEIGRALPAHMRADRLVRVALTAFRLNAKLYECEPMSVLGALFQAAQTGLEPNLDGQCFLVPYYDKKKKQYVCQFQIGYKGYVKLFYNHQNAVALRGEMVYRDDVDTGNFVYDMAAGKLVHTPNLFKDRGEVVGYYIVAQMQNGGYNTKFMTKSEVMAHAQKYSQCWDESNKRFMWGTPWLEHFDAMALKTVLIKLMPWLPKSSEIEKARMMDETVKTFDAKGAVVQGVLDMTAQPSEIDYKNESLPDGTAKEVGEAPPVSAPAGDASGAKPKLTALDMKIFEAKAALKTSWPTKGEKVYYETLGSEFGVSHMTELKDGQKEIFLKLLQGKIAEFKG